MTFSKAPGQNRTDTRSLEGYCSTVELQARLNIHYATNKNFMQIKKRS